MKKRNKNPYIRDYRPPDSAKMLPWDFVMLYVILPIYSVVSIVLLSYCSIFIEEDKNLRSGLLCLGAFILISAMLLVIDYFFYKKTINVELERYNFDTSDIEELEMYEFYYANGSSLKFDKNGMYINDELFYYSDMSKLVLTSNYRRRIGIYIQFYVSEEQCIALSLDEGLTLKILESLNIQLDNMNVLEYILSNKRKAFEQIYRKGVKFCNQ